MSNAEITHEPAKRGVCGHWVVTYKEHELSFPRYEEFKSLKEAQEFMAKIEGST